MIWLLRDLDLLSTLLRAANLSFEALLLGGIIFLWAVARPAAAAQAVESFCFRGIRWAALALAASELISVLLSTASLLGDSDLHFLDVIGTRFFVAGMCAALVATVLWICARVKTNNAVAAMIPLSLLLLIATVATSHAEARLDHRLSLALATAAHHLGTAAWIGAMPFLLVSLGRCESVQPAQSMVRRYSSMAILSVAGPGSCGALHGLVLCRHLERSLWNELRCSAAGQDLPSARNADDGRTELGGDRRLNTDPQPLLARLRRFAEVEVGLGFTAILAAASMSAQPPAVDVPDQVSLQVIAARMHPEAPRLKSPTAAQLTPPTSIETAVRETEFQANGGSDATDREWSEYNHHWAGLIVLAAGLLAFASHFARLRWARFWPLTFAGLSIFILLRADPENWPLGPRPFWASFSAPDVLQHRAAALLILCFAAFECAVQAGKLRAPMGGPHFPRDVCPGRGCSAHP